MQTTTQNKEQQLAVTRKNTREGLACDDRLPPNVSRTFALTIPQLPGEQRRAVTNAYLLCRIADTMEDEKALDVDQKQHWLEEFTRVVQGRASAESFAAGLLPLLPESASPAELDLVKNTPRVIAVTHNLSQCPRKAIIQCVAHMCEG